ncbi:MAG: phosphatase PAP2 family protein [Xanthobacteraceae bacterium]
MRLSPQLLSEDTDVLRAGSRLLWILIALMAIATAAECCAGGLSITWERFPTIPIAIAGSAAMALFYRFFRPELALIYATELIAQILLIIFLGELLTYAAATTGFPYRDAELFAVDRWLGFDVKAYFGLVDSHRALAIVSLLAYMSYLWQAPVVFIVLSLTSRIERLQDFAVSLIVSLTITIAIFALFPALGWYGYLRLDLSAFTNILFFPDFVSHVKELHSGTLRAIPVDDIRGLISFPSYHSAAAVLAVWALWPIRMIRWPLLILNALMVASTPIEGTHYAIDVIGGLAVSALSLLIVIWTRQAIGRFCAGARAAGIGTEDDIQSFSGAGMTVPQRLQVRASLEP